MNNFIRIAAAASILTICFVLASYSQTQLDIRSQGRNFDLSTANSTKPMKTGTALPAQRNTGETFFKTDAAAGRNVYGCSATNTWSEETDAEQKIRFTKEELEVLLVVLASIGMWKFARQGSITKARIGCYVLLTVIRSQMFGSRKPLHSHGSELNNHQQQATSQCSPRGTQFAAGQKTDHAKYFWRGLSRQEKLMRRFEFVVTVVHVLVTIADILSRLFHY